MEIKAQTLDINNEMSMCRPLILLNVTFRAPKNYCIFKSN